MKTKDEILKMNKSELLRYRLSSDLDTIDKKNIGCSGCSSCYDCSYCSVSFYSSVCFNCSYVSYCFSCFNCSYVSYSFDCSDCFKSSYCSSCFGCYDCYASRNLKNKQYCICNIQFTKEEYEQKMKELKELEAKRK